MAQLAQVYVHLRPYEINAESINRLGSVAQESVVAAARAIYRGNVTIETELEEGSLRFRLGWPSDFRLSLNSGSTEDIALGPVRANERTRSRGRGWRRGRVITSSAVTI